MGRRAISELLAGRLFEGGLGARRRRHRVALGQARLILINEQERPPRLAHVPLDVVGEHAREKDRVRTHLAAMVERTNLQISALERAKDGCNTAQRGTSCLPEVSQAGQIRPGLRRKHYP